MFRSWLACFLLVLVVLPASANQGPLDGELPALLPPSVPVPLDGSPLTALLYRSAAPGSEGVVLLTGPDTSLWSRVTGSLVDRGVNVLQLPASTPLMVALSGFQWLQVELGDDAIVGLGADGGATASAWQLARLAEPGATLLVDARAELAPPSYLSEPEGRGVVLLLAREEDFLAREQARPLFLSAPGRVELWLVDGEGMGWSGLLARNDVASDIAHWWVRSLEGARAARVGPVASRSAGGR